MPLPIWVTDPALTEEQRARAILAYRIKAAALHIDASGSVSRLSLFVGFSAGHLNLVIARGKLARKTELAIRQALGAEAFPTEEELLANSN